MIEQHYTADEVAEKLKISVYTVLRRAADGSLRSIVIGRARRFPESAIADWLNGEQPGLSVGGSVVEMRSR